MSKQFNVTVCFKAIQKVIQLLIILLFFPTCSLTTDGNDNKDEPKNKRLLYFQTSFLAELGQGNYDKLRQEVGEGKIESKYLNDIIYISYLDELNTCGQYDGNIKISEDTIKLEIGLTSDRVCTSTSISRITFIIDNPDEKKKVVSKYR